MLKKIFKTLLSVFLILTLSLLIYMRDFIFAKNIAVDTITKFEETFYTDDSLTAVSMISDSTHLSFILNDTEHNYYRDFVELFSRFEQGFEITGINSAYLYTEEKNQRFRYISIRLSKRALIDGKNRDYFDVNLIKVKSKWLIQRFYFPDFINY